MGPLPRGNRGAAPLGRRLLDPRNPLPEQGYAGGGNIGHFNAISGRTANGRDVVADPMYTGGTVELTREQLEQYFSPSGGVPAFTALG